MVTPVTELDLPDLSWLHESELPHDEHRRITRELAEQQEALTIMARRLPHLELAGETTWKPGTVGIFGPEHLPVRFA